MPGFVLLPAITRKGRSAEVLLSAFHNDNQYLEVRVLLSFDEHHTIRLFGTANRGGRICRASPLPVGPAHPSGRCFEFITKEPRVGQQALIQRHTVLTVIRRPIHYGALKRIQTGLEKGSRNKVSLIGAAAISHVAPPSIDHPVTVVGNFQSGP